MQAQAATRDEVLGQALRLEYLTVGWNVVEGVVAVTAALAAGSVALLGFGIDSFVESASGAVLIWRRRLFDSRWFLRFCVAMGPSGFIAVLAGWMVTEVGRQPWVVYGVLRTRDAVSPVTAPEVATSLIAYMIVYAVVFTAGVVFILRLMAEGPVAALAEPSPRQDRAPGTPLARAPEDTTPGDGAEGEDR